MGLQRTSLPILGYAGLVIGYLAFIGFASFYLPDGVSAARVARAGADELFFRFDEFRLRWWNLRDISTNILLYMPLGFLVALALLCRNQTARAGIHWVWGFGVSTGVEVVQAFIGRFSDATDVLSNGCGYLLGFAIARTIVLRFAVRPASLLGFESGALSNRLNTLSGLRFAYLSVFLVAALLPLDITVSLTDIYGKLQSVNNDMPRLILDPLYHLRQSPDFQYLTLHLLAFLPLAFLSSFIQLRRGVFDRLTPAMHCLVLGVAVEGASLFVRSGRSDVAIPALGFAVGLCVALLVLGRAGPTGTVVTSARRAEGRSLLLSAALLYTLVLLAMSLSPYEFELTLRALRTKLLNDSNFLPFRLHFSARSVGSAIDIVREFFLYAPFGALLALWLRRLRSSRPTPMILALAGSLGFAVALCMESLQLAVVGRYVDVTDTILAAFGSVGGALLAPLFAADVPPTTPVQG